MYLLYLGVGVFAVAVAVEELIDGSVNRLAVASSPPPRSSTG
jgi:hypothetical protein